LCLHLCDALVKLPLVLLENRCDPLSDSQGFDNGDQSNDQPTDDEDGSHKASDDSQEEEQVIRCEYGHVCGVAKDHESHEYHDHDGR
jgi:hypothetical protein